MIRPMSRWVLSAYTTAALTLSAGWNRPMNSRVSRFSAVIRATAFFGSGLLIFACARPTPTPVLVEQSRSVLPELHVSEVHFDSPRNQVYLPVMIGGEGPFFFILDTGADPSAIDLDLALRLGLPVDTAHGGEAAGAGTGLVSIYPATLSGLRFADRLIEDFPTVALDLAPLSERLGRPLHGILGYSFLRHRVVQIDYPGRVVRLLPHDFGPVAQEEEVLRVPLVFRPNDIIPLLEVRVNGQTVPVSLDTGSGLTLEIFVSAVERLGLGDVYERAGPIELTGVRGAFEARAAPVDSVALGPFVLLDPEITFSRRTSRAEVGRQGNLGGAFLRHFVVTLDYRRQEITIAKPRL